MTFFHAHNNRQNDTLVFKNSCCNVHEYILAGKDIRLGK
jgi:hypothetical protein